MSASGRRRVSQALRNGPLSHLSPSSFACHNTTVSTSSCFFTIGLLFSVFGSDYQTKKTAPFSSVAMSLTWPWHFVTVSPAEKQQRRELLNIRGYYAQGSVLLVIAIVRLYHVYSERTKGAVKPNNRRARKPKSWLDSPPFAGWTETRKQHIVSLLWLVWLVSLSIWNTGDGKYPSSLVLYYLGNSN